MMEETEARLRERIALDPDVAGPHAYAADFYGGTSCPAQAIAELRLALELEPDNPDLHQRLATFLGAQGDTDSEIAEFRAAVRLKPYDVSGHIYLAERLESLGRVSESLKEFDELIRLKPKDWDANNQVTDILVRDKRLAAAIADVRIFLTATSDGRVEGNPPEPPDSIRLERQLYLAGLLYDNSELDAAEVEYVDLLRKSPDNAEVHDEFGVVLFAQGNREEAAAEFREALRLDPDNTTAHTNLALCMAHNGQFEDAIEELRAAVSAAPQNQHARALLGMAYARKGDLASARSELNQAIRHDENIAEPHLFLAKVYSQEKDEVAALAEFKRVVELEPDNPEGCNDLAWLLATAADHKLRDSQAALTLATHAVALQETVPHPHAEVTSAFLDTLAEAQLLTGHPAEALASEERAAKLAPNNTEIQSRLQRFRDAASPKSAAAKE